MKRRLRAVRDAENFPGPRERWIHGLADAINIQQENSNQYTLRTGKTPKLDGQFFRWHDSGDLQSLQHLLMIFEVCRLTPGVRHKLPTKEIATVKLAALLERELPSNLTILLSESLIDRPNTNYEQDMAEKYERITLATVHTKKAPPGYFPCPVGWVKDKKTCAGCRLCWTPYHDFLGVSFKEHR
jgi:hypothetical protein